MFKKIIAFVVVGFVAVAQGESQLFSMFKQQASAAAVAPQQDDVTPQMLQNLMEMGSVESLSSNKYNQDVRDEIFKICDTNQSGLITKSEALKCGKQAFWDKVKPFDANRDNLIDKTELLNAVKYYDNRSDLVNLYDDEDDTNDYEDVSPDAMKSFFDVSMLGQSLLSKKTTKKVDQMFAIADTNFDGKLTRQEIIAASKRQGQPIQNKDLDPIFEIFDTNKDGAISKQELLNFLQSPSSWTNLVFRFLDYNRDGVINFYEFKRFLQENIPQGQGMPTDAQIKQGIASVDFNKDGKLTWSEVYQIMQQLQKLEDSQKE